VTITSYDANGNVTRRDRHEKIVDPATGLSAGEEVFSTLSEYDELDRLIATTDSLGNKTSYSYDSRGNIVRQVDALGNVRRFAYDLFNRRIAEHLDLTATGLGGGPVITTLTTAYDYDTNGNVVRVTDASGNAVSRDYDALDRRTATGFSDATSELVVYDPAGNIVRRRDGNGVVAHFGYDPMNRRVRTDIDASGVAGGIVLEGETFSSVVYDGVGRAVRESNDFVTVTRLYDSLDRPIEERQQVHVALPSLSMTADHTITRAFDLVGNETSLTYPGGRVVRRHVDALNRTERIENVSRGAGYPGAAGGADRYDIATYRFRGKRRMHGRFGNCTATSYAYDAAGRAIELHHRAADGSTMLSVQHLFDGASNIRIRNESEPGREAHGRLSYNSAHWLTRVEEQPSSFPVGSIAAFAPPSSPPAAANLNGQSRIDAVIGSLADSQTNCTFKYDACGNRTEERRVGQPPLAYTVDAMHRYAAVGATTPSYDRSGNLTGDGVRSYRYDHRNRLVRVASAVSGQNLAGFVTMRRAGGSSPNPAARQP
jgi:YD repeat-containing protein